MDGEDGRERGPYVRDGDIHHVTKTSVPTLRNSSPSGNTIALGRGNNSSCNQWLRPITHGAEPPSPTPPTPPTPELHIQVMEGVEIDYVDGSDVDRINHNFPRARFSGCNLVPNRLSYLRFSLCRAALDINVCSCLVVRQSSFYLRCGRLQQTTRLSMLELVFTCSNSIVFTTVLSPFGSKHYENVVLQYC